MLNFLSQSEPFTKYFQYMVKRKKVDMFSLSKAFETIKQSLSFLQDNEVLIRENVQEKLPKLLNGAEGNFAAKTIDSEICHEYT